MGPRREYPIQSASKSWLEGNEEVGLESNEMTRALWRPALGDTPRL